MKTKLIKFLQITVLISVALFACSFQVLSAEQENAISIATEDFSSIEKIGEAWVSNRFIQGSRFSQEDNSLKVNYTDNGYNTISAKGNLAAHTPINLLAQNKPVAVSMDIKANGKNEAIYFGTSQAVSVSKQYNCSDWKSDEVHNITFVFYPDESFTDLQTADGGTYNIKSQLYVDNEPVLTYTSALSKTGTNATYKLSELRLYHLYSAGTDDADKYINVTALRITNQIDENVELPLFNSGDVFTVYNNKILGYTSKSISDLKSLNPNAVVYRGGEEVYNQDAMLSSDMTVVLTKYYDVVPLRATYAFADNDSGVLINSQQGYSNEYPTDKFTVGNYTVKTSVFSYKDDVTVQGFLAQYNSENELINLGEPVVMTVNKNETAVVETSISVTETDNTYLKFMLWDEEMAPYTASVTVMPYTDTDFEIVKTYPNYSTKAATFSFDDGVVQDIELINSLDKYGAKATFNLVGNLLLQRFKDYVGNDEERFAYIKNLYSGHEIGNHTLNHVPVYLEDGQTEYDSHGTPLYGVTLEKAVEEINDNQTYIESNLGVKTRGIAWPNGCPFKRSDYEQLEKAITEAGHTFSRNSNATITNFDLPSDWMQWIPNGHINAMNDKTEGFIAEENYDYLKVLFIWGHSYEFKEGADCGALSDFENSLSKLKEENVYFATNGEIYDYANAMDKLVISENTVTNPSDQTIYLYINGAKQKLLPNTSYER